MVRESKKGADLVRKYRRLLEPWKGFSRKWQIQCQGKRFEVRSYGFCHWSKVIFLWKNGREFYRLTRNTKILAEKGDENLYRTEYFRGQLTRRYLGPQNCFVEFCQFLWKFRSYPTQKRFSQAAQVLKLDERVANKYTNFYQQYFCFKKR